VNLPISLLYVEEIVLECRKKRLSRVDRLGVEIEMGFFPNVLDDARGKGIDIAPKYNPADGVEKRAFDKHQGVFYDVTYLEAKPLIQGTSVSIQLGDFTVFHSQDSIGFTEVSLASSEKAGSRSVVANGKILKLSKNSRAQIRHEILTQHWTDWINSWTVDFNDKSKREIIRIPIEGADTYEERWTGDDIFKTNGKASAPAAMAPSNPPPCHTQDQPQRGDLTPIPWPSPRLPHLAPRPARTRATLAARSTTPRCR